MLLHAYNPLLDQASLSLDQHRLLALLDHRIVLVVLIVFVDHIQQFLVSQNQRLVGEYLLEVCILVWYRLGLDWVDELLSYRLVRGQNDTALRCLWGFYDVHCVASAAVFVQFADQRDLRALLGIEQAVPFYVDFLQLRLADHTSLVAADDDFDLLVPCHLVRSFSASEVVYRGGIAATLLGWSALVQNVERRVQCHSVVVADQRAMHLRPTLLRHVLHRVVFDLSATVGVRGVLIQVLKANPSIRKVRYNRIFVLQRPCELKALVFERILESNVRAEDFVYRHFDHGAELVLHVHVRMPLVVPLEEALLILE